jgi:hypothetical protein
VRTRTEFVDGLEFVVPTWDPTPVPWNPRGSWAVDEETNERVLEGIRAAVPNHAALVAEALSSVRPTADDLVCQIFWGSHGCSRPGGHPGLHLCGDPSDPCSAGKPLGRGSTFILWWGDEEEGLRLSRHHWTWFR